MLKSKENQQFANGGIMAQYKKDTVKEIIDNAALKVFFQKGYQDTKIIDISEISAVSVGNIYRYYKGKEDIFYSLISQDFFDSFQEKLTNKIVGWKGRNDRPNEHLSNNEQFTSFIIENRMLFVIIFSGCKGTRYENAKKELVDFLTDIYITNYGQNLNFNMKENLSIINLIYEKYIELISSILSNVTDHEELKTMLELANKYHLNGITSFISQI